MSDWKDSVRVATTNNITLSGFQTIDDVPLTTPSERVLVKDQTTPSQNGIYRVAAGAWHRALDADAPTGEVNPEMAVRVSEGTVNAHTEWALITSKAITLGATPLIFRRIVGLETMFVDTLAALRALPVPSVPRCVYVCRHDSGGRDGGGFFQWDATYPGTIPQDPNPSNDNDGTVVKPSAKTDTESGRWLRVYDGPLNVKWFGARGDDATDDHSAIQKVINLVSNWIAGQTVQYNAFNNFPDGGVVYLPRGRYVVNAALEFPRLSFGRFVVIRGEGRDATMILRGGDGPVLRGNPDTAFNPSNSSGGNNTGMGAIEHLTLGARSNSSAFEWNIPMSLWLSRAHLHFEHVRFVTGSAAASPKCNPANPANTAAAVYLRGGSRCRFKDCSFYGVDHGVAIHLDTCGGTTILNCRVDGLPGAFLRSTGGGELVVINCRSEGGRGIPAWDFNGTKNVTLIQPANEGVGEDPAIFRFTNCEQVVVVEPQLAGADCPMTPRGSYADGMLFENSKSCRVVGGFIGASFVGAGDGAAVAIRINAGCSYITVEGIETYAGGATFDFDNQGTDCRIEMKTATGVAVSGTTFAERVFLVNTAAAPIDPIGGGVLYVEDGVLKYRGPNSTTIIAPA